MQKKENFFEDNADIQFHLDKRTDFDDAFEVTDKEELASAEITNAQELRDMAHDILRTLGEICGSELAPRAVQVEKEGVTLDENGEVQLGEALQKNVKALLDFGVSALGVNHNYGGIGAPFFLQGHAIEMMHRACPSTGLNMVWYGSIAHIIDRFGTEELKQEGITKIAAGEWSGCMALTEPDAGSDLANLSTYAEKNDDGSWTVTGTKRFISNGSGDVALVLAMNEKGAKGLNKISMFYVPRIMDGKKNYTVEKLEEKVGLHGSATCELVFNGSKGWLLGEDGHGFKHMLVLMNEARIATGFQALGVMEGAFRTARDFANQRKTWGKPIAQHELIAEKLLDMEVDIRALRSMCNQAAYNMHVLEAGEKRLKMDKSVSAEEKTKIEKRIGKCRKRVRRWTPLIKWYAGERSVSLARDGMQVHGGYGFTTEYRAEWYLREALILPVYEGTSEIQSLMCVKDTMKEVIRQPRLFLEYYMGSKIKSLSEGNKLRRNLYQMKQIVNSSIVAIMLHLLKANALANINVSKPTDILKMVKVLSRDLVKMENISPALLHSQRLCEMKALLCMAECLVWDAEADSSRAWIAERFMNKSLPKMIGLKEEIEINDQVILDRLARFDGNPVAEGEVKNEQTA